jgi:hypothetical protein
MPRLDLLRVVVNIVGWIARWAAQWPVAFSSGCLLSMVTFFLQRPGYLPDQFLFVRYHDTKRLSKAEVVSPTRVALTNPFTTTGSHSALWLRLSF